MRITIGFESPPGTPHPALVFDPGQSIRVIGEVYDDLGVRGLLQPVKLYVIDASGVTWGPWDSSTGWDGWYRVDLDLPDVIGVATVRVDAQFWFTWATASIKIGIGTTPPPPPVEKGLWDRMWPFIAITGVVVGGLYVWNGLNLGKIASKLKGK